MIVIDYVALLAFLVFLTLKLLGVIGWDWWWVASPLWLCAMVWFNIWLFLFVMSSGGRPRDKEDES